MIAVIPHKAIRKRKKLKKQLQGKLMTNKGTFITITDENREKVRLHAINSITQLQGALVTLKGDLNHKKEHVVDSSCFIAAAICLAVEDAVKMATQQIKENKIGE